MWEASNVRAAPAPHVSSARRDLELLCDGCADVITTATENAYFGRCTSSSAVAGVGLVKTSRTLLIATYVEPVIAAAAIPQIMKVADELIQSGS